MKKMVEIEKDFLEKKEADCLYVIHDKANKRSAKFQNKRGFNKAPVAKLRPSKNCTDLLRAKILHIS